MSDNWMPILHRLENGPVSILVNLDYRARFPDPARPSAAPAGGSGKSTPFLSAADRMLASRS
jgi:hypothetical protein